MSDTCILLNLQYGDRHHVLLQLSIYRNLFSYPGPMTPVVGRNQCEELRRHHQSRTKTVVTHTMESCRLGLCKGLTIEAHSAISTVVS